MDHGGSGKKMIMLDGKRTVTIHQGSECEAVGKESLIVITTLASFLYQDQGDA